VARGEVNLGQRGSRKLAAAAMEYKRGGRSPRFGARAKQGELTGPVTESLRQTQELRGLARG
jgi:hypothetical protein